MISIHVDDNEYWDGENEVFIPVKGCDLLLEHSLISISKWESIWHKPYISEAEKTTDETLSYIKCMTMNKCVDPKVYQFLTGDDYTEIANYINDEHSAVKFPKEFKNRKVVGDKDEITSELMYYYMIKFNIPFDCEKWHFKRLLNLIEIFEFKETPKKKRPVSDMIDERRRKNAERRAKLHTTG